MPGIGFGFSGFSSKRDDAALFVDRHDTEFAGGLGKRHLKAADRHVRDSLYVKGEKRAVVHLVNVIAGQDQHEAWIVCANDVEVLVDGVRGAAVPLTTDSLRSGQDFDEFSRSSARLEPGPAVQQMPDQRMRLVLGQYANAPDARVDAVRQREIDDAELAAEMEAWLGAPGRQVMQPRALPASENQGQRLAGQATDKSCFFLEFYVIHLATRPSRLCVSRQAPDTFSANELPQ